MFVKSYAYYVPSILMFIHLPHRLSLCNSVTLSLCNKLNGYTGGIRGANDPPSLSSWLTALCPEGARTHVPMRKRVVPAAPDINVSPAQQSLVKHDSRQR